MHPGHSDILNSFLLLEEGVGFVDLSRRDHASDRAIQKSFSLMKMLLFLRQEMSVIVEQIAHQSRPAPKIGNCMGSPQIHKDTGCADSVVHCDLDALILHCQQLSHAPVCWLFRVVHCIMDGQISHL